MKKLFQKGKRLYHIRNRMILMQLFITVLSLLLCGVVVFISGFVNMEPYVENEVDFFLKSTNQSLNEKTSLLENIVISMRNDSDIMNYLGKASEINIPKDELLELSNKFTRYADIYSTNNVLENGRPFIETVYFYDNNGNKLSANYYPQRVDEKEKMDQDMSLLRTQFQRHQASTGKDYLYVSSDGRIYICWPFYNHLMKQVGTLFFSVRQDSISEVMQRGNNYKGSFWALFSENSEVVLSSDNWAPDYTKYLDSCMGNRYSSTLSFDHDEYLVGYCELTMGIHAMIAVPKDYVITLLYETYKNYFLAVLLIILGSSVLIGFIISHFTRPLREFSDKIRKVKEGDFKTKLPDYSAIEFQEISQSFNSMTDEIDHLVREVYEKQLIIREEELKFIQSQMNPHFMFNVLNTIAFQARLNNDMEVFQLISNFSRLIQATICRHDNEKVKIRQELNYVDYYLTLQRCRYGDRLDYRLILHDESVLDYYIPKLCLQLIVENAIVHGVEPKRGKSLITVEIMAKDETVEIVIQDNGVGFDTEDENGEISLPLKAKEQTNSHNRIGLNNVYNIMKIMYGEEYGIRIFSQKGKGTRVVIHIPFDSMEV